MTDINEGGLGPMDEDTNTLNETLIYNRIPMGLLDKETQERMMAWPHGWQVWNQNRPFANGWSEVKCSSQFASNSNSGYVFRAKPAPEPEDKAIEHERGKHD